AVADRRAEGHPRRPGETRGALRHGQAHQPLRSGTVGAESGTEHAPLLPQRICRPPRRCRGVPSALRVIAGAADPRSSRRCPVSIEKAVHMAAVKTLSIDGKLINARGDQTILQAAQEAGISIPTLCHLEGVTDVGACRMCLVEVGDSPRLM